MTGLDQLVVECAPQVAPSTMMAVVKVESGGNPFALNVNGDRRLMRQPATRQEAITWASWLIAHGYSVDMGLAQINSRQMARQGASVEQMFEPCANLAAGARILWENYAQAARSFEGQAALRAALSAYNTGNYRAGIGNGYVAKVTAAANAAPPPLEPAAPHDSSTAPLVYWVRRP